LDVTYLVQVLIAGITIGSIYSLIGLGFVLIYKATTVPNFAYGEMVMVGGYLGVIFYSDWGLPFWACFILAMVGGGVAAVLIERLALRPLLRSSPATVILATLAVGQILRSGARLIRGDELVQLPPVVPGEAAEFLGINYTPLQIGIVGFSALFMLALLFFFKNARWGKAMRAVSQNRSSAAIMGVSIGAAMSLAWALSGMLAAGSALLIAPINVVSPEMGFIAFKGFIAAILGGFTKEAGVVVGGISLGVVESLGGFYISSAFQDVITFAVLILVLAIRPQGLVSDNTVVTKV
jgi:branched-chain amino acid transport system permease protein